MSRFIKAFLIISGTLLFSFQAWAADDLKLEDFSGAMVYQGNAGSLLVLEIPLQVYQGLRRPDLGDIRIFDASELAVPFAIRERPGELFTPLPIEVPFFIWEGGRERDFPVSADIEINTSGAIVRINNQAGTSIVSPVFLADLSGLSYSPSTLKLKLDSQGKNYNSPVTIYSSTDLSNWTVFSKRQVIASYGEIVQDTLDLPLIGERYLLLKFDMEVPPPLNMTAVFNQQEGIGEYYEVTIKGIKNDDGKSINYFTEGFYPAETIDFLLPEADSIQVIIKNRFSEEDDWRISNRGTIFRYNTASGIEKNEPFSSDSFNLTLGAFYSQAPYWELEAAGGLPFSSVPDMVLRWKYRELIFPARGQGPWTLAYGNPECPPIGESLRINRETELESAIFTGEQRYIKTDLFLPKEKDYSSYFLWAFLGAAVLILLVLAFKIAKSMRK